MRIKRLLYKKNQINQGVAHYFGRILINLRDQYNKVNKLLHVLIYIKNMSK